MKKGSSLLVLVARCDHTNGINFILLFVCLFELLNLVPRVFSLSNMAAAGEKTLAHSELERSLIGAFHGAFLHALSLVYSFQNKDG